MTAALVFAVMALATKHAAARLPGPQIAFIRFVIGLGACGLAATRVRMRATNKVGLLMRGAYGGAAVLFYFLGIAHLPVGIATLLNYSAPVFTAMYAAAFLGEGVTKTTVGALALTSVGVVLVIMGTAPPGSIGFGRWQLVAVLSAMLSGAAVATIREVRKTDGSWEIFAAFCARARHHGGAGLAELGSAPARRVGDAGRGGRHVRDRPAADDPRAPVRARGGRWDHRAAHARDVAGARLGAVRRPHRRARARGRRC